MKMQVDYKESISQEAKKSIQYTDFIKGKPLYFSLTIKLEPIMNSQENEIVHDFERDNEFDILYRDF